jgi:Ca2+-binding EF-hand superfamily protein
MEFLALNPTELETMITYFAEMDLDKDGFIYMEEFCHYVGEPMSDFVAHWFKITDAPDEYDRLDFGETIKALSTFAMLQGDEVLKLIFAMFDPEGTGYINNAHMLEVLSVLHPHYRGRTERTLKEFDLPRTDKITFEMVKWLHIQYPNMFHP